MYRPPSCKIPVRRPVLYFCLLSALVAIALFTVPRINLTGERAGIVIDSLDGVYVYNNGPVSATYGRNLSQDGYNIGLKYQCVEFVKRYYLYRYGHRMPDSYGHARDFFERRLKSGKYNERRDLIQYTNGIGPAPRKGDLVVFRASLFNPYGHVAIVAAADGNRVEIIQQNGGFRRNSRSTFALEKCSGGYRIKNRRILGWLRIHPLQTNENE